MLDLKSKPVKVIKPKHIKTLKEQKHSFIFDLAICFVFTIMGYVLFFRSSMAMIAFFGAGIIFLFYATYDYKEEFEQWNLQLTKNARLIEKYITMLERERKAIKKHINK